MRSAGKSFAGRVISVILSLLMFIFITAFTALFMMRAGNAAMIIRSTDISEILADTEIAYYMVSQLNSLPFHDADITLYDIEAFVQRESVSNEIGGIVSDYARALNNNDLEYHLTSDGVLVIIHNLEPELHDLFDHSMTEADNVLLARTLDDILDFEGLTVGGILYDVGIDTMVPRLLLSPYLLWGAGILVLLTLCAFILLNLKAIPDAFLQSGIPITASGFLFLMTGVIFGTFPGLLSGRLFTLSRYTGGVMHLVIRYGFVLVAIGVAFIAVYLIQKRNKA